MILEMSADEVAALTPDERELRVRRLMNYACVLWNRTVHEAEASAYNKAGDTRKVVATAVLFSGGNDSTTLAHMFRDFATHAIHANTTIGIEETRQYVRDTCASWKLPLLEKTAPVTYRELVLDQGFPGPAHHWKMYQRLKERALREARRELVTNPRRERVIFLAGRRRSESERRADVPEVEYEGSVIWVSPLVYWTKLDLNTYRRMYPDVPRNAVSDTLHMSGECLCGSFAKPNELDEIEQWYPDTAAEIRALEDEVAALGVHPPERCKWGMRGGKPTGKMGALCSSCTFTGNEGTA